MRWRDILTGTDEVFNQLLRRQLEDTRTVVGLVQLFITADDETVLQQIAEEAGRVEHHADAGRKELMQRLSQTFVTQFDREDINELSRAIDDIADYAENTIKEIQSYGVSPDHFIEAMVNTLSDAVVALSQAVVVLGSDGAACMAAALRAKWLENKMEAIYRSAIASFSDDSDVPDLIKRREVYRHLSNAADRVDLAANIINRIIVKQNL